MFVRSRLNLKLMMCGVVFIEMFVKLLYLIFFMLVFVNWLVVDECLMVFYLDGVELDWWCVYWCWCDEDGVEVLVLLVFLVLVFGV